VTPEVETQRLVLKPLELADHGQVQLLFPRWEILRYMDSRVPWPYPADGALTFYRDVELPAIARGETWHWTLRLKNLPACIIGAISVGTNKQDNRGFWLGLPWQGQGLMTEASEAVMEYWFGTLKQDVMRVSKAAANVASRRISEKNGMRLIGMSEKDYVSGRLQCEIWEISTAEWKARKQGLKVE
jgi:[ribosomal protein S5]-alanine N-acetyltransferase